MKSKRQSAKSEPRCQLSREKTKQGQSPRYQPGSCAQSTMANSLEARSPLLDHELAEFVARLPSSYKFSLSRSKLLLREAMKADLPDSVLQRGKMGFSAPVAAWLRGPLRGLFQETVVSAKVAHRGFVSSFEAERLFKQHIERKSDNSRLLWNLLMLELWFRECVEVPQTHSMDSSQLVPSRPLT